MSAAAPESTRQAPRRWLKHAFDRVLALALAPAYMPVIALVTAAVAAEDILTGEGLASPFHREKRISADREFVMVKFRTLKASIYRDRMRAGLTIFIRRLPEFVGAS